MTHVYDLVCVVFGENGPVLDEQVCPASQNVLQGDCGVVKDCPTATEVAKDEARDTHFQGRLDKGSISGLSERNANQKSGQADLRTQSTDFIQEESMYLADKGPILAYRGPSWRCKCTYGACLISDRGPEN
jgi:hypothetical protein